MYQKLGKIALGSRLRRLSEQITEEAAEIYKSYGIDLQPKWFPVFYVLSQNEVMMISDIAAEIGHSQPSVSKIVREMAKGGIIEESLSKEDKRKNMIALSTKGKLFTERIVDQYQDIEAALDLAFTETNHDLWKAIQEWEYLLATKSLSLRVREARKSRESKDIEIIDYDERYRQAFRDINVEWISKYFVMEEADYKALDHPDTYIIDKGGHILIALYKGEVLGVCAMIKMHNSPFDYELAKMGVTPKAQGKNIGFLLGEAVISKAKSLGAKSLFLESHTSLIPALSLYKKLGFKKVVGYQSPYERSDIQMAMEL
jgi:DNA-binding MarR family transcriptional regulator/GNAT superfamily N-acetyltransferase